MRKVEERFPEEVVVVGVHSAKFDAEKPTYNVRQAVLRHDVRHPVVNDRDFLLWRAYTVRAWPTLMIVSPDGMVLGKVEGEFDGDALADVLGQIVQEYEAAGKLDRAPLEVTLEKHKQPETLLSFPGKVLAAPPSAALPVRGGDRGVLFVSDTEHHRILAFGLESGKLLARYGSGEPGRVDGSPGRARFRSPLGLGLRRDALFVADSENHAVRKIALETGVVTTLAGTGEQAAPWPEPGPGPQRRLNSPRDVLPVEDTVYIAMAGSHQLWAVDLPSGQLLRFAGDGREALKDAPRLEARLAQPGGLATDGKLLWFADSETSSVRAVPLPSGRLPEDGVEAVETYVGQGLFDFGDVDGPRATARLQHALGLACAGGMVFVADTYNNKIKVLDPRSRQIRSFSGSGEPGLHDGAADDASFWEPDGLSVAGSRLYVADTNNHLVREVSLPDGAVRTLALTE